MTEVGNTGEATTFRAQADEEVDSEKGERAQLAPGQEGHVKRPQGHEQDWAGRKSNRELQTEAPETNPASPQGL